MEQYRKKLCEECILDGKCVCQQDSMEQVANCGMGEVLAYNERLRDEHRDFENEREFLGK